MTLLLPLAILAVLAIVLVLAVGRGDGLGASLSEPVRDRPPAGELPDSAVAPQDIGAVRFTMALRGYRMAEVDTVLDRLADELAVRDERIAALEHPAPPGDTPPDLRHDDPPFGLTHDDQQTGGPRG